MKSTKAWLLAGAPCMGVAQADERDVWMFAQWAGDHENRRFREMLVAHGCMGWCHPSAAAFGLGLAPVPSLAVRGAAGQPLAGGALDPSLIKTLDEQGILRQFEVVSAYRDPSLNACAGGAPSSAHMRAFAVDLLLPAWADPNPLCRFWQQHGQAWNMGLGRYPSGRIHIDTAGYRTWGGDGGAGSSFCSKPK
jgi:hypothetical protein